MTPFRRLVGYFARYRRTILFGAACVFMTNLIRLGQASVLGSAIDDLVRAQARGLTRGHFLRLAGLILLIEVSRSVFLFTQRRLLINMSRDIEYDLRNDFYTHLHRLPFECSH